MAKEAIFKVRLSFEDDGRVKAVSYTNRLIPLGVFEQIHNAVHEAVAEMNGDYDWRTKLNLCEDDEGNTYCQFIPKSSGKYQCEMCCFCTENYKCSHPYYLNGKKGKCDHPYKKI